MSNLVGGSPTASAAAGVLVGFGLLGAVVATKRRVSAKQRREELVKKTLNVLADFEAQPESIYDGDGKLAAAV